MLLYPNVRTVLPRTQLLERVHLGDAAYHTLPVAGQTMMQMARNPAAKGKKAMVEFF